MKRILLVLLASMWLSACNTVTQEDYAKLKAGMTKAEVEAVLGKPKECSGAIGVTSCTWGNKDHFISIQFVGDKVLMYSGQGLK